MLESGTSSSSDPVKIVNLPSSVESESLAPEILHKLAEHKHGSITLKAYMYTYAGITQLRFNVHSMCTTADPQHIENQEAIPALLPPTPAKGENPTMPSPSQASPETPPSKKLKQTIT
ncbi:hypothetical protein RHMOL_Rhmol08G0244900 [Rhododendron molle]|uniref:Uncharacterized protein n=1 Tax=Rhododendron molle TaxID=49168 RepID=A0ACC0MSB0_RHOML|nr:hypothetical protein RHMOL_Rhmol08G0244900 [Rhododendron molle]